MSLRDYIGIADVLNLVNKRVSRPQEQHQLTNRQSKLRRKHRRREELRRITIKSRRFK